jgi:hypothetical protein
MSIQKGYEVAELTYAERNPQTVQISDGVRARKTDDGYVLETLNPNGNWIGGGGSGILIADETFTDAQIRGATSNPLIVIPSTETLGYVGFPTSLPLVLKGYVILDSSAGFYTNIATPPPVFALVIGSDWSLTAGNTMEIVNRATVTPVAFPGGADKYVFSFLVLENPISNDDLQDNAIGIVIPNTDGAFTGGNAANSMRVILYYVNQDLS